jgi:hypothetical protein
MNQPVSGRLQCRTPPKTYKTYDGTFKLPTLDTQPPRRNMTRHLKTITKTAKQSQLMKTRRTRKGRRRREREARGESIANVTGATRTSPLAEETTEGVSKLHTVRERREKRARTKKLTKVSQSLLHRRLGHRSISSLLLAVRDVLWDDIQITPDRDELCETCEITLFRKAKKGNNPLEDLGEGIPGQMVMIDIIHNPIDRSITTDTYHKYYSGVIDVASRYFVPMGMPDKKPVPTVFNALKEWARLQGCYRILFARG